MSERDDYDPPSFYPLRALARVKKIRGVIGYLSENVSRTFLIVSLLIVVTLPFFRNEISSILRPLSIFSVVLLVFLAAFTNKKYKWTIVLDAIVSMFGLLISSFQSVDVFTDYGLIFFAINLVLSVMFLLSFYFSISAIREWFNGNGDLVENHEKSQEDVFLNKNIEKKHYDKFEEEDRRELFKNNETR